MFKKAFNKSTALVALAVAATLPVAANAAVGDVSGWDYSTLTSGIDFSTIGTGVLAVAALLAAVYAGIKGAKIVLGFLRG